MPSNLIGILGIIVILLIAVAFSSNRKAIHLRVVSAAFALQAAIAAFVLYFEAGRAAIRGLSTGVLAIISYSKAGIDMVFGPLANTDVIGFSFAINVLPIIIFFAALMSVLYHLRIMEWLVRLVGGALHKIIGTGAIRNPDMIATACRRYPGRIIVGIDARDGFAAIEGWTQTTRVKAVDLARQFEDCGVAAINFPDIHRDGMQTGPNFTETRRLAEAVSIPVIASGGVSTIEDIRNLLPLEASGVTGVITGRALYSGSLDLAEAIRVARG